MADIPTPARISARFGACRPARRLGEVTVQTLPTRPPSSGWSSSSCSSAWRSWRRCSRRRTSPNPYQMPRDWAARASRRERPAIRSAPRNNGGDVLYGVIWGARTSLYLSLIVVAATVTIGIIVGSLAASSAARSTRS